MEKVWKFLLERAIPGNPCWATHAGRPCQHTTRAALGQVVPLAAPKLDRGPLFAILTTLIRQFHLLNDAVASG